MFEAEFITLKENLIWLCETSSGQYVLLHHTEIVGIFPTQDDAIRYGHKILHGDPFLVREIVDDQEINWNIWKNG